MLYESPIEIEVSKINRWQYDASYNHLNLYFELGEIPNISKKSTPIYKIDGYVSGNKVFVRASIVGEDIQRKQITAPDTLTINDFFSGRYDIVDKKSGRILETIDAIGS
ncbi:hypothetical protein D3C72_2250420 [compost metagenome]